MLVTLMMALSMQVRPVPTSAVRIARRHSVRSHSVSRSVRARGNLIALFSDNDYPTTALARGQQGTVGTILTVGKSGAVTRCAIVKSSKVASLDAVTCRILRERAQFEPARDRSGRPTVDRYMQRVTWRIPDEEEIPSLPPVGPGPFVDWQSTATFMVTDDAPHDCRIADDNTPTPFRIGSCQDLAYSAQEAAKHRPSEWRLPYRIQFALRLVIGETAPTFASGPTNLSRRMVNLRIGPEGFVMACDPIGEMDSVQLALLCFRARSAPFEAAAAVPERRAILMISEDAIAGR